MVKKKTKRKGKVIGRAKGKPIVMHKDAEAKMKALGINPKDIGNAIKSAVESKDGKLQEGVHMLEVPSGTFKVKIPKGFSKPEIIPLK